MDPIDMQIILALDANCRLSYQMIAKKLGLSATAVKKRMDKLVDTGIIEEFSVFMKPAMVNSDYLVALLFTDGSEDEEQFMAAIGANLNVVQIGQVVTGVGRLYSLHSEYIGAEGLQNLLAFLRTLDSVTNIESHTILTQRGEKFEIENLHLRVLKPLLKDARMQIGEISKATGLTARRVNRAIKEMLDSNAFWFAIRWNLGLGNNAEFDLKITYREKRFKKDEIDEWLRTTFPNRFWYSYSSAMEPILFAKFMTEHFRDAEHISSLTRKAPFSESVDVLLSYPVKKFPRLGRIKIEEMIRNAGL